MNLHILRVYRGSIFTSAVCLAACLLPTNLPFIVQQSELCWWRRDVKWNSKHLTERQIIISLNVASGSPEWSPTSGFPAALNASPVSAFSYWSFFYFLSSDGLCSLISSAETVCVSRNVMTTEVMSNKQREKPKCHQWKGSDGLRCESVSGIRFISDA